MCARNLCVSLSVHMRWLLCHRGLRHYGKTETRRWHIGGSNGRSYPGPHIHNILHMPPRSSRWYVTARSLGSPWCGYPSEVGRQWLGGCSTARARHACVLVRRLRGRRPARSVFRLALPAGPASSDNNLSFTLFRNCSIVFPYTALDINLKKIFFKTRSCHATFSVLNAIYGTKNAFWLNSNTLWIRLTFMPWSVYSLRFLM